MKVITSAYHMLTQSNFAKNYTLEGINAIANYLEDNFEELDEAAFDEILLNSTEFQTVEDACEEYDCKDLDDLLDNDDIAATLELDHGGVVVVVY